MPTCKKRIGTARLR